MGCNCNDRTYSISMGCCEPVLGPVENYYTKYQVDKLIESATASGCCITPEEVDEKIASAKTDTQEWVIDQHYITGVDLSNYALKEEIPDISGYATEQWVNDQGFLKNHQSLEGYATENWVQNQGYLTEHQPIKTINNQSLIGEGNIDIGTGGTIDLSNYYTTAQTVNLVESAVTRVEGEIPSLSGYATEQWVLDKHYISGVDLSDYALKSEIPTVPTSNTAFTNDAGYLTEHQSLSGYATEQWVEDKHYITGVDLSNYATKAEIPTVPTSNTAFTNDAGYLTEHQSLSGKADVSAVTQVNNALTSHTSNTNVHVTQTEKNTWNSKVDSSTLNNYMLKSQIWCGTESEYEAITTKDNNVIYLIHE